jgi:hypothetical protein
MGQLTEEQENKELTKEVMEEIKKEECSNNVAKMVAKILGYEGQEQYETELE